MFRAPSPRCVRSAVGVTCAPPSPMVLRHELRGLEPMLTVAIGVHRCPRLTARLVGSPQHPIHRRGPLRHGHRERAPTAGIRAVSVHERGKSNAVSVVKQVTLMRRCGAPAGAAHPAGTAVGNTSPAKLDFSSGVAQPDGLRRVSRDSARLSRERALGSVRRPAGGPCGFNVDPHLDYHPRNQHPRTRSTHRCQLFVASNAYTESAPGGASTR